MFTQPLLLQIDPEIDVAVHAPELGLSGRGDTPIEAMDDLCANIVDAIHKVSSPDVPADDPLKAAVSGYFDLSGPCPDPDAKRCSS